MKHSELARKCHIELEKYRKKQGHTPLGEWKNLAEWRRQGFIKLAEHVTACPDMTAEIQHDLWVAHYIYNGWTYGAKKNEEKKTHPCICPWDELPEEQKYKSELFNRTVIDLMKGLQNG